MKTRSFVNTQFSDGSCPSSRPRRTLWPWRLAAMAALAGLVSCAAPTPTPTAMPQPPTSPAPAPTATRPVASVRSERLKRTVNTTRWFWQTGTGQPAFYPGLGGADLQLIARSGFTAIRLVVDPRLLFDPANPAALKAANTDAVDQVVRLALDQGLAVIVDMHDDDKAAWEQNPAYVDAFTAFWEAFARRFARYDPERVFFEMLNEPVFRGRDADWARIQRRLVEAIRRAAPEHTIIATGNDWGGLDGLLRLEPLPDANVIYSFHFYEPFAFTHQGATWSSEDVRGIFGLPYPADPAKCKVILDITTADAARATVAQYCRDQWDAAKVEARIARAADWGKRHGAPVFAGEFGVYCQVAPATDRVRWIKDTREAFDRHGVAWALWGYDDCFGLGRSFRDEKPAVDESVLGVLGLTPR